jgi:DNA polymerase III epsilon subunit-like protein
MDQFYKKLDISIEAKDVHSTGITCMFIASKNEEIYPPVIKDFINITDNAY